MAVIKSSNLLKKKFNLEKWLCFCGMKYYAWMQPVPVWSLSVSLNYLKSEISSDTKQEMETAKLNG